MNKHVYVARSDLGPVKIGHAKNVEKRIKAIVYASGINTDLCASFEHDRARAVEIMAHKILADRRRQGEWFEVSVDEAKQAVEQAIELTEAPEPRKGLETSPEPIDLSEGLSVGRALGELGWSADWFAQHIEEDIATVESWIYGEAEPKKVVLRYLGFRLEIHRINESLRGPRKPPQGQD